MKGWGNAVSEILLLLKCYVGRLPFCMAETMDAAKTQTLLSLSFFFLFFFHIFCVWMVT